MDYPKRQMPLLEVSTVWEEQGRKQEKENVSLIVAQTGGSLLGLPLS